MKRHRTHLSTTTTGWGRIYRALFPHGPKPKPVNFFGSKTGANPNGRCIDLNCNTENSKAFSTMAAMSTVKHNIGDLGYLLKKVYEFHLFAFEQVFRSPFVDVVPSDTTVVKIGPKCTFSQLTLCLKPRRLSSASFHRTKTPSRSG